MERVLIRKHRPFHPWIFSNEIQEVPKGIEPGSVVEVHKGKRLIGSGFYNPYSLIAIRLFAGSSAAFDHCRVRQAVKEAYAFRTKTLPHDSYRLVFSESDGLPGLIVDRYGKGFVIQIHSYGMERHKNLIVDVLKEYEPDFIYEKSDPYLQKLEHLNNEPGFLYGKQEALVRIQQDDLFFAVNIQGGQKTGYFFDLLDVRRYVRSMSQGRKVLDLFTYTGSLALYAARGGAVSVLGVDSSESALDTAHVNARENNCTDVIFERSDVFDLLARHRGMYDLIILDPPSFSRSRRKVRDAVRGYRDINVRSMRRLNPGGFLVTTCCSYHVSEEVFLNILQKAAQNADRRMRVVHRIGQSLDHPVLLGMPETRYLTCYVLQAL